MSFSSCAKCRGLVGPHSHNRRLDDGIPKTSNNDLYSVDKNLVDYAKSQGNSLDPEDQQVEAVNTKSLIGGGSK